MPCSLTPFPSPPLVLTKDVRDSTRDAPLAHPRSRLSVYKVHSTIFGLVGSALLTTVSS